MKCLINYKKYLFRISIPGIYSLLVLAALIFMFQNVTKTPFCAVYAIAITMPWSIIFMLPLALLFPGIFGGSMILATLIVLLSAFINIVWLFFIGYGFDKGFEQIKHNDFNNKRNKNENN